ncbi:MAG: MBL fold metallo-hydrolase [Thermomicrobiales bacterium]|nr:MBL fold metallo-hydrolase [Thermomicrobiales bacterium]
MAEIRWLGHSCIRIRSREALIIMDPVGKNTGYSLSKQQADIVTVSHPHEGHNNLGQIKPDYVVLDGPGEYELHGVFIYGARTYHDNVKGAELGYNTIFTVLTEGIRFTHLGDLGHQPKDEVMEEIEGTDVLIVPAGGGNLMTPAQMAELVGVIAPKMVIPVQFRTDLGDKGRGEVSDFARQLGEPLPEPVDKLTIKSSDLGEKMQFVLLSPNV